MSEKRDIEFLDTYQKSTRGLSAFNADMQGGLLYKLAARFTHKQGQCLSFIYFQTKVNDQAPAEAEMERHTAVTPPSVHQMVITLEHKGLIKRTPGLG